MSKHPRTLGTIMLLTFAGAVLALAALWRPFAYIFVGLCAVALIVSAVRDDRKPKP